MRERQISALLKRLPKGEDMFLSVFERCQGSIL